MSRIIRNSIPHPAGTSGKPVVGVQTEIKRPNAIGSNPFMTAEKIEEIQKQAYDEAFAQGLVEGKQAMQQEMKAKLKQFDIVMSHLEKPFQDLDNHLEKEILELVLIMVRQLVRREMKTDSGQIIALIREGIQQLPSSENEIQIHLHPEDAVFVEEMMAISKDKHNWRLVVDPVVTQGGCKIVTQTSLVDMTMESRLNTLFANVLGGQRNSDQSSDRE